MPATDAANPATPPTPTINFSGLTKGKLRAAFNALSILGNRRMKTINGDLRAGWLIAQLEPLAAPLAKARNRITVEVLGEVPPPEKLSPSEDARLMAVIEEKRATFDAELVDEEIVKSLPTRQIRFEDLPLELSGDNGQANTLQRGAIIADLGPWFRWPENLDAD